MSSSPEIAMGGPSSDELHALVKPPSGSSSAPLGFLLRPLEKRTNVKMLLRRWRPRLFLLSRLMLVSTFLDDSLRTVFNFSALASQISDVSSLDPFVATLLLFLGLAVQLLGAVGLLVDRHPAPASLSLIAWTSLQPFLYGQQHNPTLLSEALTLVGGLLLLRAVLVPASSPRLRLLGRLLLPATYVWSAGSLGYRAFALEETGGLASYLGSLSAFAFRASALAALALGSGLVACGLRSRAVALVLALLAAGTAVIQHPFFLYTEAAGYQGDVPIPDVALPEGTGAGDLTPGQLFDLHRYYFFLGISSAGAFLLLAQAGPGEHAVQKDEMLLPTKALGED